MLTNNFNHNLRALSELDEWKLQSKILISYLYPLATMLNLKGTIIATSLTGR